MDESANAVPTPGKKPTHNTSNHPNPHDFTETPGLKRGHNKLLSQPVKVFIISHQSMRYRAGPVSHPLKPLTLFPTMRTLKQLDEWLAKAESGVLVFLLFLMVFLAFGQVILRNFLSSGLLWTDLFLRQMVLWVGFLGASLAVRERRHISIDVSAPVPTRNLETFYPNAGEYISRFDHRVSNDSLLEVCPDGNGIPHDPLSRITGLDFSNNPALQFCRDFLALFSSCI